MTITAGAPRRRAARATPCAWFPDEYEMTPRARASGASDAIAAYAPRILNAPIGWRDSAFRNRRSSGRPYATSGVSTTTPRSWSAAARMAPIVTSGAVSVVVISTLLCREALAVDTTCGPRQRLEPVGGDRVPAPDAPAERSGVETRQSLVDKRELALGAVPQGKIALLGEDLACSRRLGAVGHLARRDDRFADLVEQPGTLVEERGADRICAGHRGDGTRTYAPWEYAQEPDDEHRDRPGLWHGGRHHHQP